jgi:hypothetical protein
MYALCFISGVLSLLGIEVILLFIAAIKLNKKNRNEIFNKSVDKNQDL